MKAWHFVGNTLRDGSPVPADGETVTYEGDIVLCESGLHASKRIVDALQYAPGSTICRVEVTGAQSQGHTDKIAGAARTILWRVDGERVLRRFARLCALDVFHLWSAPPIVVEYLKTGNADIRAAARAAAEAAARAAAWDAAGAAAGDAAEAAAWDAAEAAAGAAAWAAARAAAWGKQNRRLASLVVAEHRKSR